MLQNRVDYYSLGRLWAAQDVGERAAVLVDELAEGDGACVGHADQQISINW